MASVNIWVLFFWGGGGGGASFNYFPSYYASLFLSFRCVSMKMISLCTHHETMATKELYVLHCSAFLVNKCSCSSHNESFVKVFESSCWHVIYPRSQLFSLLPLQSHQVAVHSVFSLKSEINLDIRSHVRCVKLGN